MDKLTVYTAQVQVWVAPVPIHSCVGAIANRARWEQGCSLPMATDLGPVRATHGKKKLVKHFMLRSRDLFTIASEMNLPKTKVSIYINHPKQRLREEWLFTKFMKILQVNKPYLS